MIVDGFDGLNVSIKLHAYEAKALRAFLQASSSDANYLSTAARYMQLDGHPFEANDVQAVLRQAVINLRKLAEAMDEKPSGSPEAPKPN